MIGMMLALALLQSAPENPASGANLGWGSTLSGKRASSRPVGGDTRKMSFSGCLSVIQRTAEKLKVTPVNVSETQDLRIVRFPTKDGSVTVACDRPGKMMTTTTSGSH